MRRVAQGETEEAKALLSMTASEANRLLKSRRRLLLEYAQKIELAQINKGIDAGYLFKSLDSNCDGRLSSHDLGKGLKALQGTRESSPFIVLESCAPFLDRSSVNSRLDCREKTHCKRW